MKCLMSMSGGGNRRMQSNMENEISYYRSVVNRIDVENSCLGSVMPQIRGIFLLFLFILTVKEA